MSLIMASPLLLERTGSFLSPLFASRRLLLVGKQLVRHCQGAVLGFRRGKDGVLLTPTSAQLNTSWNGKLDQKITKHGSDIKCGQSRVFYDLDPYKAVAVACLSDETKPIDFSSECLDEEAATIREAVSAGVRALHSMKIPKVDVDSCGNAKAAAEGAHLATFFFDNLKSEKKSSIDLGLIEKNRDDDVVSWKKGSVLARAQNLAREWEEMPSNFMTPSIFAETVTKRLLKTANDVDAEKNLKIHCWDREWIANMKMGGLLGVAKGSDEEPKFLEIQYTGTSEKSIPSIALVGKGVTFDTGGISIKPSANMDWMRGDMSGAAVVCATLDALLRLKMPVNVRVFVPLCENMPSGCALKPGDVITAMNGKTIQVDNTDAEGRLILADALTYASSFNPNVIIDVATLTGAMMVALGSGAAGVFCTSDSLWQDFFEAGYLAGDRFWRMPLFKTYRKMIDGHLADINNVGESRYGGACTAAAFLKEFVTVKYWAHVDIAGVMWNDGKVPCLSKGLTGRPTRAMVEAVQNIASIGHLVD